MLNAIKISVKIQVLVKFKKKTFEIDLNVLNVRNVTVI